MLPERDVARAESMTGSDMLPGQFSAPETIRTSDTRFRRAVLYPLSYGGAAARR